MKTLDKEQVESVLQLNKILFAREILGFVKLPDNLATNPRAELTWSGNSRLTIIEVLTKERDLLLTKLGIPYDMIKT
jgi:hypothetical protein